MYVWHLRLLTKKGNEGLNQRFYLHLSVILSQISLLKKNVIVLTLRDEQGKMEVNPDDK